MERSDDFKVASTLTSSLEWCKNKLMPDDLEFLKSFKRDYAMEIDGHTFSFYHGSPRSNIENIYSSTPDSDIGAMFNGITADYNIGGHTHLQMLRRINGKMIANSGSVGCSFTESLKNGDPPHLNPFAEFLLVEMVDSKVELNFHNVAYDVKAFIQETSKGDLPIKDWWIEELSPYA
jgi:predicted phosphodiesterase